VDAIHSVAGTAGPQTRRMITQGTVRRAHHSPPSQPCRGGRVSGLAAPRRRSSRSAPAGVLFWDDVRGDSGVSALEAVRPVWKTVKFVWPAETGVGRDTGRFQLCWSRPNPLPVRAVGSRGLHRGGAPKRRYLGKLSGPPAGSGWTLRCTIAFGAGRSNFGEADGEIPRHKSRRTGWAAGHARTAGGALGPHGFHNQCRKEAGSLLRRKFRPGNGPPMNPFADRHVTRGLLSIRGWIPHVRVAWSLDGPSRPKIRQNQQRRPRR